MISLQDIEINEITLGDTPVVSIEFGDIPVWPSGYYYTLTVMNNQPVYSNTGSSSGSLLASGENYCTFKCYYDKYTLNNVRVSREEVYAEASFENFKCENGQFSFDYTNHKDTYLLGGSKTAILSYRGVDSSASFNFGGNTYDSSYHITAPVLNNNLVDASGGTVTYTGGVYDLYWNWTSGYEQYKSSDDVAFQGYVSNHDVPSVYATIDYEGKSITVESLAKNTINDQSYYTFNSTVPTGVSITVYQKKNSIITNNLPVYRAKNLDTGNYFEDGVDYNVPATPVIGDNTFGRVMVEIDSTLYTEWESGAKDFGSPTPVPTSSCTYIVNDDNGHHLGQQDYEGCVTSVYGSGSGTAWTINYNPNTTQYDRWSEVIIYNTTSGVSTSVRINQPHQ